jgi:hypothetical protein
MVSSPEAFAEVTDGKTEAGTILRNTSKFYPASRTIHCSSRHREEISSALERGDSLSKEAGALSPYRVLDLADTKGAYCTKLFADLGADVIKVEAPEGAPGRKMPPFAGGVPHHEKSLYFLHRSAGKRGITLDIETPDGRGILFQSRTM